MLRHWSQFVPNMSTDIQGHEALHYHERKKRGFVVVVENFRTPELCESRGGRPGLPVLMSIMVSVDVKRH